jgi:hypothetical protein
MGIAMKRAFATYEAFGCDVSRGQTAGHLVVVDDQP